MSKSNTCWIKKGLAKKKMENSNSELLFKFDDSTSNFLDKIVSNMNNGNRYFALLMEVNIERRIG